MNYSEASRSRVFVTGATGLIGKELLLPLQQAGYEVHALSSRELPAGRGIHWHRADLFDSAAITSLMAEIRPQFLLNMAWATTGDYLHNPINYSFLAAGIHLLQAFAEHGGKRAIFAGTCFEYRLEEQLLSEDSPLDVEKTCYTRCKDILRRTAEHICRQRNISFGWGRIFYVYGHGEANSRLVGMIVDHLSRGQTLNITSGPLIRDYMYSRDIARAFVQFLGSRAEGCVNICTGTGISIRELAMAFARHMDCPQLLTFENKACAPPQSIIGDNTRLREEIGFHSLLPVEEAVREILLHHAQ